MDRASVDTLSIASTSLPFADRLNAGIVKEALNLSDAVAAFDMTGSQRAGTSALLQSLSGASTVAGTQLVLASEMRFTRPASEGEMTQGDAAAALLVGQGDVVARYLGGHSVTVDFVDHFRATGERFDYSWESRWLREEGFSKLLGGSVRDALALLNVAPETIDRMVMPITTPGVAAAAASRAGIRPSAVVDSLAETVGNSGAAHALLLLAAALEVAGPGERIMLIGFGQGVDVLLFETTDALATCASRGGVRNALARGQPDINYLRWLFHRGLLDLDVGMRAEYDQKQPGTTLWRNRKAVLGLVAQRSSMTGEVRFIGTVQPSDEAAGFEDYPLADREATVVSFTSDRLTYSPSPPSCYGMLDFVGGGRMITEFTDVEERQIRVGQSMRMMFRIKAIDRTRHFSKYFWKAVPAGD
jgi:uncharacterized OB-fold protein